MSALAAAGGLRRRLSPPGPQLRTTAPFVLAIVAAWIAIVVLSASGASRPGMTIGHGMAMGEGMAMTGAGSTGSVTVTDALPIAALMLVAMMLPGALSPLWYVARHSFRWRRGRAMSLFAVIYLAVWVGFAVAALTVAQELALSGRFVAAGTLALASVWQLTPFARRALRDCHRSVPLRPEGGAADRSVIRFGALNGWACLRSCWPVMGAMFVLPGAMAVWMAPLTLLMTGEKLARRPRRARLLASAALAVTAVVVFALDRST